MKDCAFPYPWNTLVPLTVTERNELNPVQCDVVNIWNRELQIWNGSSWQKMIIRKESE